MIAQVSEVAIQDIETKFNQYRTLVSAPDNEHEIVALMKALVTVLLAIIAYLRSG